jgi:DNA-binding NtrC family response regulator
MAPRTAPRALVLVVDDDRLILRAWTRVLAGLAIELRCVDSAEAALEAVREERPAVVLSDHHMPGTSGLQLLTILRAVDPTSALVLVTTDPDALRDAERRGFAVFDKTTPPEGLRDLVVSLLERAPSI